jgi:imidazole glycerol-phosphate synthase subunit HisF
MSSQNYEQKMFYGAPGFLHGHAKHSRRNPTKAEEILWQELKKHPSGYKFRRQHPIAIFIADFYCHRAKLDIEVDGSVHELPSVKLNDEEREWNLESMGVTVLRFKNEQVLNELPIVLQTIIATVEKLTS